MALIESISLEPSLVWQENRGVTYPLGYAAGSAWCGLKSSRGDLALIVSKKEASAAGVFTQNQVKASSVDFSREVAMQGRARAIFCSSGNANACVGPAGMQATEACGRMTADLLGCRAKDVLVAHTGVIGKPYDVAKAAAGVSKVRLDKGEQADSEVALAILTTDTCPKQHAVSVCSTHWQGELRIGGVSKGSGMIAPNMATTLCFLTTDAAICPQLLQRALNAAIAKSFNRITVDGDTSTNDMALVLANGAGAVCIADEGPAFDDFALALESVCMRLAKMVARDGEGATKLVSVTVSRAATEDDAVCVAKTIAESPLVKTALFGNDPNWGRILAAAGRSRVPFNPSTVRLAMGPHVLFANGVACPFDKNRVHDYLKRQEVEIALDLNEGTSDATVWTCDYSYDYIRINAEYHT